MIASIVIYFKPEWKQVDPVCTIFFALIVLCTTIGYYLTTGFLIKSNLIIRNHKRLHPCYNGGVAKRLLNIKILRRPAKN